MVMVALQICSFTMHSAFDFDVSSCVGNGCYFYCKSNNKDDVLNGDVCDTEACDCSACWRYFEFECDEDVCLYACLLGCGVCLFVLHVLWWLVVMHALLFVY
eukprot:167210_1